MTRRAHGSEDKALRRREILDAARGLFVAGDGELPSAARIAEAAGLAKGTVYLYFRTKEAIFADLLLEGWSGILDDLEAVFGRDGDRAAKVAAFVAHFVDYLDRHPELLRMDALGHGIVERNLEPATLHAFKQALSRRLMAGGAAIEQALALPDGRGSQLLMRIYALTRGLWQSFGDGAGDAGYDGFTLFQADFRSELIEALTEYWRGALAG